MRKKMIKRNMNILNQLLCNTMSHYSLEINQGIFNEHWAFSLEGEGKLNIKTNNCLLRELFHNIPMKQKERKNFSLKNNHNHHQKNEQ